MNFKQHGKRAIVYDLQLECLPELGKGCVLSLPYYILTEESFDIKSNTGPNR